MKSRNNNNGNNNNDNKNNNQHNTIFDLNNNNNNNRNNNKISWNVLLFLLVINNVLMFQFMAWYFQENKMNHNNMITNLGHESPPITAPRYNQRDDGLEGSSPPVLPSIRLTSNEENDRLQKERGIYGGNMDQKHLGGFTEIDVGGLTPAGWKLMINEFGIHSVIDVGCGRGISTTWFLLHGVDTLCVEGSHDAVERTMIPPNNRSSMIIEHDFSRGPWWPPKTYDAVWCVEFVEHVGRNYHVNYVPIFRKAALLFVTHAIWGGWHHVEVHNDEWWKTKFLSYGFFFSESMTRKMKNATAIDRRHIAPDGTKYAPHHINNRLLVFINPAVASLPQHAHLFSEHGCFAEKNVPKKCGTGKNGHQESVLPEHFMPLPLTDDMDTQWETLVQQNLQHQSN